MHQLQHYDHQGKLDRNSVTWHILAGQGTMTMAASIQQTSYLMILRSRQYTAYIRCCSMTTEQGYRLCSVTRMCQKHVVFRQPAMSQHISEALEFHVFAANLYCCCRTHLKQWRHEADLQYLRGSCNSGTLPTYARQWPSGHTARELPLLVSEFVLVLPEVCKRVCEAAGAACKHAICGTIIFEFMHVTLSTDDGNITITCDGLQWQLMHIAIYCGGTCERHTVPQGDMHGIEGSMAPCSKLKCYIA